MNIKKKGITFALVGLLGVGSLIPVTAKAAESWDYGYNQSKKQWYNHYYHTGLTHWGSISKNGARYNGPVASAGYWSRLNLDFNGPYKVSYNKHVK
ncbi:MULTISPECIES: lactococcin 972 family bacteriocin [Bacillus]|uniref:lactococcin 972 family bacteriocin n=1 Tax=Bacillus TaxID=1386 RepID=UPI001F57E083|nr:MULTISPECIES: lactococcin 972 family bacteriocin [Bacillus cereus group]MDA1536433.1 lactococcin 972 family bacteriocin [Bacillus cereus group sp. TH254-2LC]MDA1547832.1 lactococcin 972 family bacteriocin [Bacillus cereus group sp. TH253LC]MDA1580953.1 lactococcin 972 family bacteriocin [Bacillus cereus group sp. TH228LC]MDA1629927.1 lactococcin 972 family bacteriocin [Bacillus cereus group sp. TH172LC]MDA1833849.1 lactococcin 972 family bacteriocin [Bacillus cereus group sp. BY142LC]